jgi:plastocyanin
VFRITATPPKVEIVARSCMAAVSRDRFGSPRKGVQLTIRPFAAAVALTLLLPAAAHAATKAVYMGAPPKDAKKFNAVGADTLDFFPGNVTIAAGDSVKFNLVGFHNVDIPPKGGKILDQLVQTTPITGVNDAAGNPFWYSGGVFKNFAFAPALQDQSNGLGQRLVYTGAKRIISHIPLNTAHPFAPFKPMLVKFPKAGTYTYFCDLHPGMKGTVTVLKKRTGVPTAAQDSKALAKQVAGELKTARTLRSATAPANTMYVGYAGDKGKVEYINFLPSSLTVPVGTTVTFSMSPGSFETHTATAGPGDYLTDPSSYIGAIADSFNLPQFDPRGVYPSEPLGTIGQLTPTSHGNGFWNSGALDAQSATALVQPTAKVTFAQAGVYHFACMIHPVMRGTVTVQ